MLEYSFPVSIRNTSLIMNKPISIMYCTVLYCNVRQCTAMQRKDPHPVFHSFSNQTPTPSPFHARQKAVFPIWNLGEISSPPLVQCISTVRYSNLVGQVRASQVTDSPYEVYQHLLVKSTITCYGLKSSTTATYISSTSSVAFHKRHVQMNTLPHFRSGEGKKDTC